MKAIKMTNKKPKPCPFCGGDNIQYVVRDVCDKMRYECQDCESHSGCGGYCEEEELDIWNTRPTEDALQARITELEKAAVVWHRYPDEKPELGKTYNVTCYHESCAIDKYRVVHGVIYSNENDNEQFYAELWNHSIGAPYLSKVACVIAFSDPLSPYIPEAPKGEEK